jgi:alkylated DNA repair dioxygenase AlkB
MAWQPSLLSLVDGGAPPHADLGFASVDRVWLDSLSWVDYAPEWVSGADELFAALVERLSWSQHTRWMYERTVVEPRLTAWWSTAAGAALDPPVLEEMRRGLGGRYGVDFDSVGFNLYRNGRDSVAWHGDRIAKEIAEPLVALVSLGERRRFLLRPKGGGRSTVFSLGLGDLLVTGGGTQRRWEHSVPKVAAAGPRMSIAFRHGAR